MCTIIFHSFFSGRINYYTCPPEQTAHHVAAEIVHNWGRAFDMVSGVVVLIHMYCECALLLHCSLQ